MADIQPATSAPSGCEFRRFAATLGVVLLALSLPLLANAQQVAPSRVTPGSLAPPPTTAPTVELPGGASQTPPPGAADLSVQVGQFEVSGTFPEFEGRTSALLDPLRGKRMTVAQIYEQAAALEHAYATAGFILARVVVPPQNLADGGPVRLVVIDGMIERVDASRAPARLQDLIARRLAPLVGKPHVTLDEIERRLLLVGDLPGLQLRSTLARGETPGGTLLIVEATQNLVTGSVGFDDRLPSSLGIWSINTGLALNNALGLGEQAYVSYSSSPDLGSPRLSVLGVGVVLPLGADGLTLNPEYTQSIARPISPPGAPATVGDFQRFAMHANYPVIRTRTDTLTVQLTVEWDDERLTPTGFATQLYHDDYDVLRLEAHDTSTTPWGAPIVLDGVFSQGVAGRLGSGAIPLSQQGANPIFSKIDLTGAIRQPLPAQFELDLTGRVQDSFRQPLMLAEQFSLDGVDALSSFDAGSFSVDRGASLRAELARPILLRLGRAPAGTFTPYIYGAVGYGDVIDATAAQLSHFDAGSAGIGVRSAIASALGGLPLGSALAVEVGRQFSNVPGARDGYRANIALNITF